MESLSVNLRLNPMQTLDKIPVFRQKKIIEHIVNTINFLINIEKSEQMQNIIFGQFMPIFDLDLHHLP